MLFDEITSLFQRTLHSFANKVPAYDTTNENTKLCENIPSRIKSKCENQELVSDTVSVSNVFVVHSLPATQNSNERLW